MLTDKEKWLFDLHGYLVLRQVVSPEEVEYMTARCDEWHGMDEDELAPPLCSYDDPREKPPRREPFSTPSTPTRFSTG